MHNILYCKSMMWLTFDTWVFADQASSHDAQKHCRHDGQHAHWNRPPVKLCAYHVFYESCFVCLREPCVHTVELSCYVGWTNQGSKRIKWPIGSWLQSHNFIQIQHYLLVPNYRWKWTIPALHDYKQTEVDWKVESANSTFICSVGIMCCFCTEK